jgi:hypothetical protein
MRESFVFYASFYEAIKELPDNTQLELYAAICKYSLYGELPELSPISKALFTAIKPNIDKAAARYVASVENGKKGGRPPKKETQTKPSGNPAKPNNNPDITQTKPSENLNVYVDVNDNVDDNVNADVESKADKPQRSRFTPPTLEEVQAYCQERDNGVDPEQFIAFYSSKGWKIGSSKMKDWKAAVITWEKREKREQSKPEKKPAYAFEGSSIDQNEMMAILKEKYGI